MKKIFSTLDVVSWVTFFNQPLKVLLFHTSIFHPRLALYRVQLVMLG